MDAKGALGQQLANILAETKRNIQLEMPDKLLVFGDTNSALAAIIAKRYGIPVYHLDRLFWLLVVSDLKSSLSGKRFRLLL